jgi:hypothetical protein
MGIFDSLRNKAVEKMAEKFMSSAKAQEMMKEFMDKDGAPNLEALAKDPKLAAMADQMKNIPDLSKMTPEQVQSLLEHPMLKQMTSKLGMKPEDLAKQLSSMMPMLMKQFGQKK